MDKCSGVIGWKANPRPPGEGQCRKMPHSFAREFTQLEFTDALWPYPRSQGGWFYWSIRIINGRNRYEKPFEFSSSD